MQQSSILFSETNSIGRRRQHSGNEGNQGFSGERLASPSNSCWRENAQTVMTEKGAMVPHNILNQAVLSCTNERHSSMDSKGLPPRNDANRPHPVLKST